MNSPTAAADLTPNQLIVARIRYLDEIKRQVERAIALKKQG